MSPVSRIDDDRPEFQGRFLGKQGQTQAGKYQNK